MLIEYHDRRDRDTVFAAVLNSKISCKSGTASGTQLSNVDRHTESWAEGRGHTTEGILAIYLTTCSMVISAFCLPPASPNCKLTLQYRHKDHSDDLVSMQGSPGMQCHLLIPNTCPIELLIFRPPRKLSHPSPELLKSMRRLHTKP